MSDQLTPAGENLASELQGRFGVRHETAVDLIYAVRRGNGTMAQFSNSELGQGQWMKGGMTMVSDMFNHSLKARVADMCEAISLALGGELLIESGAGAAEGQRWWPFGLGTPSSSGIQNSSRYAVFPGARRLAVHRAGKLTIYDTGDHRIRGVGQQQSGGSEDLYFTSQLGQVDLSKLKEVHS